VEDIKKSIASLESIVENQAPPDFLPVIEDKKDEKDEKDDDSDSVITVSTYSASSEGDEDPDDIYEDGSEDGYEDIFAFDDDDYGPFW